MTTPATGRKALAFIFVTVFVDVVGIGITVPVGPKLIAELAHTSLSEAARYGGLLMFVYAGMQFLFAPVIGNLSDRFGRRPLLILSLVMLGVNFCIVGLAQNLFWLFLGRFLSGMAGASYTIANAYVADVTPPEKRAGSFGLMGAAFGVGFVIGPALGGVLGDIWIRLPFFVSGGLAFANAAYGFFILKESLSKEHRRPFRWRRANPLGALSALKRHPNLLGICGVLVLMRFAHDSTPSVWPYFTMLRFHWTMKQVGLSLMGFGLVTAVAYGGLTRILIPRLGEVRSVYLGLAAGVVSFAGIAAATAGWQLYALMPVFSLVALVMPALNTMMSRTVGAREQGELQGALTSLGSLTSVAAPIVMTNLFSYFTGAHAPVHFPGAAFAAASLCLVAAIVLLTALKIRPPSRGTGAAPREADMSRGD